MELRCGPVSTARVLWIGLGVLGKGEYKSLFAYGGKFTELDLKTNLMRKGQDSFIHLAAIPGLALFDSYG